jgi:hypothetical protein
MPKKDDGPNLFTFLNAIFYKNKNVVYDKKKANAYMLSLWLSHDKELINIVNRLNPLQFKLSDDLIYQYYMNKIPRKKRFIKWVKKEGDDKKRKKTIDKMKEVYGISTREAKMYLTFLDI